MAKAKRVRATEAEVSEGTNGGCLFCGEVTLGDVEPDARCYECKNCGKKGVYGLEELLVMGMLDLADDSEDGAEVEV